MSVRSTFWHAEDGSALVEFGLLLPMLLLTFAISVEGSRTFWAYQTTISGVRDASRFVAKAASSSLCETGGTLNNLSSKATEIVAKTVTGDNLFPSSISVASVTPTLSCVSGNYSMGTVPIVTITANLQIDYPFSGVFNWVDVDLGSVTTTVSDSARIYGS